MYPRQTRTDDQLTRNDQTSTWQMQVLKHREVTEMKIAIDQNKERLTNQPTPKGVLVGLVSGKGRIETRDEEAIR